MQFQHSSYLSYPAAATRSPITQGTNGVSTSSAPGAAPNTLQYPLDQQTQHSHMDYGSPGMPHRYPTDGYGPHRSLIPPPFTGTPRVKPKRKQVKNACVNCQKACKKCDDTRPCPRCVKYGITTTCINSIRKERKKGAKRGPYKQRKGQDGSDQGSSSPATPVPATLSAMTPPANINGSNSSLLLNHANPYIRSFHDPSAVTSTSGVHDGYPPQGTMIPPYGIMHQVYSPEYHTHSHQTPVKKNQQQPPQQQATATAPKYKGSSSSGADSDEEGSKLNILSQLCSAVLDHSDTPPKEEGEQQDQTKKEMYGNSSNNSSAPIPPATHGYQHTLSSATRSPHHLAYTPNGHHSYTAQQQQQQIWPLPPLQSVVPTDRNMYYQQQQQPQQPQQQQQYSFHPSSMAAQQQQQPSNGENHWNGSQW